MQSRVKNKISQLTIDEFKELVGQIIEEKLQNYPAFGFYYDEDSIKTALGNDSEDEMPFSQEFEKGLKEALQDVKAGRIVTLKDIKSRQRI